jgi:hypothetical protein
MGRRADSAESDLVGTGETGPDEEADMDKYVIEREVPGAGTLSDEDLKAIAQRSVEALDGLAGRAQWLESFVTDDKLFCVYLADGTESIEDHARDGGFPCNAIRPVHRIIDPSTATAPV